MATFKKLGSGNWRVQIRREGRYLGKTFRRHKDAGEWSLDMERRIDRGETFKDKATLDPTTLGHLITLHVEDMKEVGLAPRRSKAAVLATLKAELGRVRSKDLTRERLIVARQPRSRSRYADKNLRSWRSASEHCCCRTCVTPAEGFHVSLRRKVRQ